MERPVSLSKDRFTPVKTEVTSNLTKEQYEANVKKAKEYIKDGDIFQVVLSQRFEVETDVDPFDVYRCLRTLNPSPYLYFFDFIVVRWTFNDCTAFIGCCGNYPWNGASDSAGIYSYVITGSSGINSDGG